MRDADEPAIPFNGLDRENEFRLIHWRFACHGERLTRDTTDHLLNCRLEIACVCV